MHNIVKSLSLVICLMVGIAVTAQDRQASADTHPEVMTLTKVLDLDEKQVEQLNGLYTKTGMADEQADMKIRTIEKQRAAQVKMTSDEKESIKSERDALSREKLELASVREKYLMDILNEKQLAKYKEYRENSVKKSGEAKKAAEMPKDKRAVKSKVD